MADATLLLVGSPVLLVLLACSALFSSAEMAIFSLPPLEPGTASASDGDRSSLDVLRADHHRLLVTPVIGLVELALLPAVVLLDAVTCRVNAALSGDEAIERPYLA